MVWWLCRRLPLPSVFTLALAGGLLLGHHAYIYDALLILPALMVRGEETYPEWLRKWALVLFTPVPYLFLLTDMYWIGHLTVTGYTVALMGVMVYRLRSGSFSETVTPGRDSIGDVGDSAPASAN